MDACVCRVARVRPAEVVGPESATLGPTDCCHLQRVPCADAIAFRERASLPPRDRRAVSEDRNSGNNALSDSSREASLDTTGLEFPVQGKRVRARRDGKVAITRGGFDHLVRLVHALFVPGLVHFDSESL